MRVVLIRPPRGERGAVAILVAVAMTLLVITAALVVDFGQAYVNKNQAQTAADAGALAAAKVYMGTADKTCDQLADDEGLATTAKAEADGVSAADLPGSTPIVDDLATCEDGTLEVHYGVEYDSPLGLGRIASDSDHVTVTREATAAFGHAQQSVGNLRPWMVCGSQVPDGSFPSKVVEVHLPGNGHFPEDPKCPTRKPGDWWRTTCFNGGGSHGDTENNVLYGCDSVQIVPGQNASWTPETLSSYLRTKCGPESVYCLADDSGRDVKQLKDEWDTLLGKTIAMPVFCGKTDCTPSSVTSSGNWPVWKIAAVTVCGYALKGKWSTNPLPAGDCQALNADSLSPKGTFPKNADIGFLLIFRGLIAAGTPTTFEDTEATLRLVK